MNDETIAITTDEPSLESVDNPPSDNGPEDTAPPSENEQRPISPREEAMNHIVAMREQEQEEQEQQQAIEEPDSHNTLTLKVDGNEKEITLEQAKAELQKNQAADKRLTEAARKQQQLADWEQSLLTREQQLQTPASSEPSADLKETVQTAVDSLYDGETEDAVEALTKVLQQQTTSVDPQQISQQATARVMAAIQEKEFETERQKANQQFDEEYQDITSDPQLYNLANQKTIDLMQQHPDWSPTQIVNEAGRQTRDWVYSLKGSGSNSYQQRMQRKSNLTSLPRSQGSVAYQQPRTNNGPVTPKQVIADMRQSRGQA